VVKNVEEILKPLVVIDCENGVNVSINLTTTCDMFQFKFDEVYHHATLGI
jgi:hypothetical protein